jgi:hypothetical protein
MSTRRLLLVLALLLASLGLAAAPATSAKPGSTVDSGADCNLPESDAEELVILNFYYPNKYVWDDTHLTVAVQAAPNVSDAHLAAVRDAVPLGR